MSPGDSGRGDFGGPPTVLVRFTGIDQPGVTTRILDALSLPGVSVLDLEQVVVRGQLTLAMLLELAADAEPAATRGAARPPMIDGLLGCVHQVGDELGMTVECWTGRGDSRQRREGRVAVAVLAEQLPVAALGAITSLVAAHGANIDRIRRLSRRPVTTIELEISGAEPDALRRELATASAELGVDVSVAVAGLARRGRRLLVMDVDSTLIQDEVIELLATHAGRQAEVAAVTEAAMRGELDFAQSLHQRVATLQGLDVSVLEQVRDAVRLTPGAARLCRTLRRLGCTIGVVSGGFTEIVEPLAASLGISYVRANRLEVVDGTLTGRVAGPVIDRAAKAQALREWAAAERLPLTRTVAVGDGANDLDMLAIAGLGVAFNAKPLVRQQASAAINVPYLDAVLYLLGISSDEVDEADALPVPDAVVSPSG